MSSRMKTIGVDLWAGQVRGTSVNAPTLYAREAPRPARVRPIRDLFVHAYARFAATCRVVDEPGVALIAIDGFTGQAAGIATVRARVDRHVAAIVGRHDRCDLFLSRAELALRHFAVIVPPVQSFARHAITPFRLLDLRTTGGLVDEEGRELRGLRAEGPAVVRCGGYVIFALPLGDATDWPASADDAWACLPQRVYLDELEHLPEGSAMVPIHRSPGHSSVITRTRGPWDSSSEMPVASADGDAAGTLYVSGPQGTGRLHVSRRALADGILLGRYARCDGAGLGGDASVSRVHALMLLMDDRLLLVDTASRNGSREVGSEATRLITITGDSELQLGCKTQVRWRWSS